MDFLVRVHVIGTQGLRNANGDWPCARVEVTAFGETAVTARSEESSAPNFNNTFSFRKNVPKDDFSGEDIIVDIYDEGGYTGAMLRELLGSVCFSLKNVHTQPSHTVQKTWFPIVKSDDPMAQRGFIRLTIGAYGPGHDIPLLGGGGAQDDENVSLRSRVVSLVDLDKDKLDNMYQLNVRIHKAQGLPNIGMRDRCFPWVTVNFNNLEHKTPECFESTNNPSWNMLAQFPCIKPCWDNTGTVQIWGLTDVNGQFELGETAIEIDKLFDAPLVPTWYPFYQHPSTKGLYSGSLLISAEVKRSENKTGPVSAQGTFSVTNTTQDPTTLGSILRVDFYELCFESMEQVEVEGVFVNISFGDMFSEKVEPTSEAHNALMWDAEHGRLEDIDLNLPTITGEDKIAAHMCPDLILDVCKVGEASALSFVTPEPERIMFAKVPVERMLNWEPAPKWIELHKPPDEEDDHEEEIVGHLLISLNLGLKKGKVSRVQAPPRSKRLKCKLHKFRFCAAIYQGVNLPIGDPSGLSDPMIVITFGGHWAYTRAISQVLQPEWNEMLTMECWLPKAVQLRPDFVLKVWDKDEDSGNLFELLHMRHPTCKKGILHEGDEEKEPPTEISPPTVRCMVHLFIIGVRVTPEIEGASENEQKLIDMQTPELQFASRCNDEWDDEDIHYLRGGEGENGNFTFLEEKVFETTCSKDPMYQDWLEVHVVDKNRPEEEGGDAPIAYTYIHLTPHLPETFHWISAEEKEWAGHNFRLKSVEEVNEDEAKEAFAEEQQESDEENEESDDDLPTSKLEGAHPMPKAENWQTGVVPHWYELESSRHGMASQARLLASFELTGPLDNEQDDEDDLLLATKENAKPKKSKSEGGGEGEASIALPTLMNMASKMTKKDESESESESSAGSEQAKHEMELEKSLNAKIGWDKTWEKPEPGNCHVFELADSMHKDDDKETQNHAEDLDLLEKPRGSRHSVGGHSFGLKNFKVPKVPKLPGNLGMGKDKKHHDPHYHSKHDQFVHHHVDEEEAEDVAIWGEDKHREETVVSFEDRFRWLVKESESRPEINGELEVVLDEKSLPYGTTPLFVGSDDGSADTVGKLKYMVCVLDLNSDNQTRINRWKKQLQDITQGYHDSQKLIVRLYALSADGLPFKGGDEAATYLWIDLPDGTVMKDRARLAPALMTEYNKCYQLTNVKASFSARITVVEVVQGTTGEEDEILGATSIDIEDRWFHPRFAFMMEAEENRKKLDQGVPIENRKLQKPGNFTSSGYIKVWLEVLHAEEIGRPKELLPSPEPEPFELRVAIFTVTGVFEPEAADLYVLGLFRLTPWESLSDQTDTHNRADDGKGTFNWRFIFDVKVPAYDSSLKLQLWDDNIGADERIAEVSIDMSGDFYEARLTKTIVEIPRGTIDLTHSARPGEIMGVLDIDVKLIPASEARQNPQGKAREEPNTDPFLNPEDPHLLEHRALFATPDWIKNMPDLMGAMKMMLLLKILAAVGAGIMSLTVSIVMMTKKSGGDSGGGGGGGGGGGDGGGGDAAASGGKKLLRMLLPE